MFANLLTTCSSQRRPWGVRVTPDKSMGYEVLIWIGTTTGERLEWYEHFAGTVPVQEGIDKVAATVLGYCQSDSYCSTILGLHKR